MNHSWEYKRLGEVCDIYQPKTISTKDLVESGEYDVFGANGIIGKYTSYNHEEPEVLLTCRGATCGTINLSNPKSWINGNAMVVHPKSEGLSKSYLRIVLQAVDYTGVITGAAQPQITRISLSPVVIPLPSLEKQNQIVSELGRLNELIELKRNQFKDLDTLAQSLFYETFGDPIENPKGWQTYLIKDVSAILRDGPFGSNLKSDHYTTSGVRVIRLQNIGVGYYNNEDCAYISESHWTKISKYTCFPGDIVIGTLGNPNIRACIVPQFIEKAVHKADCVRLVPNKSLLNSYYVTAYINTETFLNYALKDSHGATRSRISCGQIAKLRIPVPPLSLQNEFAMKIKAIEEQKRRIESSIADLQTLLESRMDYWFND